MKLLHRGLLAAALLGACLMAPAQSATVVAPSQLGSANVSGTIAASNVFQSLQTYNPDRSGCLIQNQSTTNTMWVYFGPVASATKAASFMLDSTHGLQISCSVGGTSVLRDQVSITGTISDAFVANFQ